MRCILEAPFENWFGVLHVETINSTSSLLSNYFVLQVHIFSNRIGAIGGQAVASAIRCHPNFFQIAQNMFGGETKKHFSVQSMDSGDVYIAAVALEKNDTVTQFDARSCGLQAEDMTAIAAALKMNTTSFR